MILYKDNIFIPPFKTGTYSMINLIVSLGGSEILSGTVSLLHSCNIPKKYNNYNIYLMVRNPYDRLVSMYYYAGIKIINSVIYDTTTNKPKANKEGLISFKDFVDYIYVSRNLNKESLKEQDINSLFGDTSPKIFLRSLTESYSLCNAKNVIHIEYADNDLKKLGFHFPPIPQIHKTKDRKTKEFKEYFTPKILEVANTWCLQDAEKFGYEPL